MLPLLFFLAFVSSGHLIVRKLNSSVTSFERLILSCWVGISLGATSIALVGFFIGTFAFPLYLLVAIVLGIFEAKKIWVDVGAVGKQVVRHKIMTLVAVVTCLFMASPVLFSGWPNSNGIRFQEAHDNLWHIALIQNLHLSIPPQHPSFEQIPLTNYHYFYDVFLASLSYKNPSSIFPLYFQFSPLLLAGLLVGSAIVLGRRINGWQGAFWLTFMTAAGGSFAYLIPYLNPIPNWHESSFWVSQTFATMVNPQMIYSLGLTYTTLWLLTRKQKRWQEHLLIIILLATSMGFKSYSWVVLSPLYAVSLLMDLWQKRDKLSITAGLLYLVASFPIVWLVTGFKGQSFFFYQPFWFLDTMVEAPDRLNVLQWKFLEDHYRAAENWPRVFWIKGREAFIFYSGNLGMRFVGMLILPLLLLKKWVPSQSYSLIFLSFFGFLFSSSIPLFFLQHGQVWNTIQFWYYSLIFANVLFTIAITVLLSKLPKKIAMMVGLIFIALAIPTTIHSFYGRLQISTTVSSAQYQFLQSLSPQDNIAICPTSDSLFKSVLIDSLSPAKVYLSDPSQLELVGADESEVKKQLDMFNQTNAEFRSFISDQKISYLLCAKDGHIPPLTAAFGTRALQIDDWWVFPVLDYTQ